MANIPTPNIATDIAVGAQQDRSRDEFHSGPYLDVTEYPSIRAALQESATGNGAAYIPAGTTIDVPSHVLIDSALNGATLVGDGADSVIRIVNGEWVGIYFRDKNAAIQDVTIANLRLDANNQGANQWGIRKMDTGQKDKNILLDNIWVHDADGSGIRMDGPGTTIQNASTWGQTKWHGIGGWNTPPNDTPRSEIRNCLSWDNKGYGIDASEGSWLIDGCLATQNGTSDSSGGMKTSTNTEHTTIQNTVLVNNHYRGFNMSGTAQNLEVDNVLVRGNGEHGIVFAKQSNVTVGTLYTIENGYWNLFLYDNPTVDATHVEACGATNAGVHVESGSGTIETLVASGNGGDNVFGNVDVSTVDDTSCEVPDIAEIIEGTSSSTDKMYYHNGNDWKDASLRYYDGEQFTDVTINQPSSS